MKKVWFLIIGVGMLLCQSAFGDEVGFRYHAKTGDKELDLSLGAMNVDAQADMNLFVKKLSLSYGVPERNIEMLLTTDNMAPADVYMSVKVAHIARQPLDTVVREYKANQGKGWGVIAKNLGIKPGSPEFHALKRDDAGMMGGSPGKGHGNGHGRGNKGKGRDKD